MGIKKLFNKWFGKDRTEKAEEAGPATVIPEYQSAEQTSAEAPQDAVDDNKLFPCPVCGGLTIEEPRQYEICSVCGWEDDPVQRRDPDMTGGANKMSLNQAKAAYAKGEKVE